MEQKRLYNLDLLRIIAMLMVVTLHFLRWGGVLTAFTPLSLKYNISWIAEGLCIVAVNCYILISGYFLVQQKFKIKKVLALICEVLFYSISIYILLLITGKVSFSVQGAIDDFLPILTNEYWFITAYVGMYLLAPFINRLIQNLNKKEHLILIVVISVLFSLWPTLFFFGYDDLAGYKISLGYSVSWFLILYIVAAFIRKYYKPDYKIKYHIIRYFASGIMVPVCLLGSAYLLSVSGNKVFQGMFNSFMSYNSVPVFVASISLFMVFLNIKIEGKRLSRLISFFAPLTFGVYLIHQQRPLASLLWAKIDVISYIDKPYFILFAIGIILSIYIVCSLIDCVRVNIFKYFGPAIFSGLASKIDDFQSKIIENK